MSRAYRRRLSTTEAREGRIMVLKSALGLFPPVGEPFRLRHGRTVRTVAVEAEPCTCRGPDRPHEHYYLPWPGLTAGTRLCIEPDEGAKRRYTMTQGD